ncbi:MAG: hypothetical protein AAF151_19870 [Cyanobacteria bacterium J06656_5]
MQLTKFNHEHCDTDRRQYILLKKKALTIICIGLCLLVGCTNNSSRSGDDSESAIIQDIDSTDVDPLSPDKTLLDSATATSDREKSEPLTNDDSPETRGRLAKLSSEQVVELLNAELESPNIGRKLQAIVVPSYIPSGFEVEYFKTSSFLEGTDYFYEYYYIVYKNNDADACFFISASALDTPDAGADATEVEKIEKINVEKLGIEIEMGLLRFDQSGNQDVPLTVLGGQEEFEGSSYAFGPPDQDLCNENISLEEMTKILESLQYLDSSESGKLKVISGVRESYF